MVKIRIKFNGDLAGKYVPGAGDGLLDLALDDNPTVMNIFSVLHIDENMLAHGLTCKIRKEKYSQ